LADICGLVAAGLDTASDAAQRAESAIHQWAEHGLLEVLTVGSRDAVVFVHLALGEFLAGRRMARLDATSLRAEVERCRRRVKWREPIAFAAGAGAADRIIPMLVSLDSPGDPESTEATLAAAALVECEIYSVAPEIVESVAEKLKTRLRSSVPLIAIEAGLGLADLAASIPEFVPHHRNGYLLWHRFPLQTHT